MLPTVVTERALVAPLVSSLTVHVEPAGRSSYVREVVAGGRSSRKGEPWREGGPVTNDLDADRPLLTGGGTGDGLADRQRALWARVRVGKCGRGGASSSTMDEIQVLACEAAGGLDVKRGSARTRARVRP